MSEWNPKDVVRSIEAVKAKYDMSKWYGGEWDRPQDRECLDEILEGVNSGRPYVLQALMLEPSGCKPLAFLDAHQIGDQLRVLIAYEYKGEISLGAVILDWTDIPIELRSEVHQMVMKFRKEFGRMQRGA